MSFESFAAKALLATSAMLGVVSTPDAASSGWRIDRAWAESGGHMIFEASSAAAPTECRRNPEARVRFPMVIQGVHTLYLDGREILSTGDPTFESTRSFYGSPVLQCAKIAGGMRLTWRIDSFMKYFARIPSFPRVEQGRSLHNVFAETMHVIGAGGMLTLALFILFVFWGKTRLPLVLSLVGSCAFASVYFAASCSGFFGFGWTMFAAHKAADLAVWAAIFLLINSMRLEGLVPRSYFWFYAANVAIGMGMIWFGRDGDAIQLGTSLPFASVMPLLVLLLAKVARPNGEKWTRRRALYAATMASFISACVNEMFVVTGALNSPPMLPLGFLCGITLFAFALNDRISQTYRERDFLRDNLELEVRRKTAELQTAMLRLRSTQAELVQSAKLASLGTLSAGIAHEINNSLNYVNGALPPLEKIVARSASPEDKPKLDRLINTMKEGLNLTFEIIKSLRTQTGLNQAKFNDVRLLEAAQSSLAILRSRTRGKIEVAVSIPEDLTAFGSVVGLNQVFMNLISNAVDAMPDGGRLTIEGDRDGAAGGNRAVVRVRDTGVGMSSDVASRAFEPFFTTKDVGQGSGLGLHIVRGEVDKHSGSIAVESEPGRGTCFTITLPIQNEKLVTSAAASPGQAA